MCTDYMQIFTIPFYIRGLGICRSEGSPGTNPPRILRDNGTIQSFHSGDYIMHTWPFYSFSSSFTPPSPL